MSEDAKILEDIGQYKYGFHDPENYVFKSQKGLSQEVVENISRMKGEPQWMLDFRLKGLEHFQKRPMPTWGADISGLDLDNIFYYVKPTEGQGKSWEDVPDTIKNTFDKLGIPEAERKFLAGVGAQYESEMVYHSILDHLEKQGVIFLSIEDGLRQHPDLFREYFSTVIPIEDNKFAALNSAVWSGGSFVYVPKGVKVDLPLQAYFRLNTANVGQFERSLIIVDEGAQVHYMEGCFLAGAKVRTRMGEKPIEEIENGDEVLTHMGRYRKVYHTMERPYVGMIYNIRYFGDSGRELHVTEEHPLLVVPRERAEYRNINFEPKWISASQVKPGDYLAIPVPQPECVFEPTRDLEIPIGRGRHAPVTKNMALPLEPDFFRLLGYYYSEGHTDKEHYLSFSFNVAEQGYLADTRDLLKRYFGKAPIEIHPRQNGQTLVLCSTEVARAFTREFGSTVYNKRVPDYIRNAPLEQLSEWVRGMWRGDGSYDARKNMFRFNSVSAELAYAFRDTLLRLGVAASVNLQKRAGPRKDLYAVIISSPWNEHFGEIVGHAAPNGQQSGSPFYLDENYLYAPIRAIEIKAVNTPVINFSVEEDESYVCDGVVSHNCTAPQYTTNSFHSGVIEIIVKRGARSRYTTIQNWSTNVYNLVTQRAKVFADGTHEWVDANLGCLTGDTQVLLSSGTKCIKDIEPGDEVFSTDVEMSLAPKQVVAKTYSGRQRVYRLQTENYREIKATANHPFLALIKGGKVYSTAWKRLDQLKVGDRVAISGNIPAYGVSRKFDFLPERGKKNITLPESSSEDLMWLLGVYIGDGYMEDSGNAHEKRVSRWVFALPQKQRIAFIEGYIAADGHRRLNHKNLSITSANRDLLEDVRYLAISCGLNPRKISRWSRREKKPLGKEEKEYTHYFLYFGEQEYEQPIYFSRVTSIEEQGIEDTWDIEINGTHNFIANGLIVHNSKVTMKYPSCYLMEPGAHGEMLSMAFAGPGQVQDAGSKMVHFAPHTSSKITSKSISRGGGRASYRGLLKVYKGAHDVKSNAVCDALLLDPDSRSDTYPYIEIDEDDVTIGHEASVSKVGEEQLFYLMSRGLSQEEATTMVVSGFIEPLVKELPMEYAVEMNRLIQLQMEGSIG
ncbi:MAG: SufD family Fe-S cluster assembly protein [Anaerolineales bacterium]|nr:SufD family Fe-S cluster assembly protein [Anaerolineales bacterium]